MFFQPNDQLDGPDSLLNFDTSWGLFDDQSSTSNMATANLIGSVLRDFQRPSWCDASTPRTQPREELVQIPRRQFEQLIHKQDIISQKLDHVIALLCQTPSAAQQPQTVVTLPPANLPEFHTPSVQQPLPPTSSPSITDSSGTESQPTAYHVPHEELFTLKNRSRSRANFAVLLLKRLFEPSELEGRNIAGVRGKEKVNPVKVSQIKEIVNSFFPTSASEEVSSWRECRRAMDEFLRRPIGRKRTQ